MRTALPLTAVGFVSLFRTVGFLRTVGFHLRRVGPRRTIRFHLFEIGEEYPADLLGLVGRQRKLFGHALRHPVGPLLGSHLFAVLRLSRRTDRGKQHRECRYKKMFRFHNFKI